MRLTKNEFPNPLLAEGRDDYRAGCEFKTNLDKSTIKITRDSIIVPISYVLQCQGLERLLETHKAEVVLNVKSPSLSYSRIFPFADDSDSLIIKIPKYSVSKKIELVGTIVAKVPNKEFTCPGEFNELYFKGATFDIRKGDILATEAPKIIYLDDSELEKPLSSIFLINKRAEQEYDIMPVFDEDKIEINVSEGVYDSYYAFREDNDGALLRYAAGILIYPALVEALDIIKKSSEGFDDDGENNYDSKRWYRAIVSKLKDMGIQINDITSSVSIANKLLGNIAVDSLQGFKETVENELNNGEVGMIGGED